MSSETYGVEIDEDVATFFEAGKSGVALDLRRVYRFATADYQVGIPTGQYRSKYRSWTFTKTAISSAKTTAATPIWTQ